MRFRDPTGIVPVLCCWALVFGVTPAWSQTLAPPAGMPAPWFVYTIIVIVFVGALLSVALVRAAVANTTWSLSDALSEETELTAIDKTTSQPLRDASGNELKVTELRASVSRLIALMGMLVILFMFLGFGSFAMYRFAMTGNMPSGMDEVINFLVAGLTLFAPYAVNKFSSLFESLAPKR
jgi:hypothetical protein